MWVSAHIWFILRYDGWKQRLLPGRQLWASFVELADLTPALTRPHGSKRLLPCLVPPTSCDQNTRDREVKRINTFQSKRFCFAGWTFENNIIGELCGGGFWLLAAMVVGVGGTNRAHQTNNATIHVPSSVMENVFPPDTENRLRGKSAKTTDGERGPCPCGSGSALCEPHSHLHRGKRKQACAPQRTEQGGNERPDLIPLWAGGSDGLEGQGDLCWILVFFTLT